MTLSTPTSWAAPRQAVNAFASDLVAMTCAISAGVHAALVEPHVGESVAMAAAFVVAAVALAVAGVIQAVQVHPVASVAVAGVLLTTATAYLLSRTTGIPGLTVHPEPFDTFGVAISLLEVAAAAVAVRLSMTRSPT